MAAYVRTAASVNVTLSGTVVANGTAVPFSGTGVLVQSAGTNGTFNGGAALLQSTSISGTITAGGQSAPYGTSVVDAYDAATTAILGESQSSEVDVAPGTLSRYTDNTLSMVLGTEQISVAVTRVPVDPASPEVVQFTFKIYDANQVLTETDTQSYLLTATGALSFYGGSANAAAGTLTVTAQ